MNKFWLWALGILFTADFMTRMNNVRDDFYFLYLLTMVIGIMIYLQEKKRQQDIIDQNQALAEAFSLLDQKINALYEVVSDDKNNDH